MRYSELERKLKNVGCYKINEGKRHETWVNPITGKKFMVGRHKTEEVPIGTLKSIMRDAGLE